MYILALATADSSEDKSRMIENETRSHWVLQIYMTSMTVVQTASNIRHQLSKSPTRLFKILAGAVSFLILLKCSKYHSLVVESTLSGGIRHGCDLLRDLAITSDDIINRAHSAFQRLSMYSETLKPEDKTEELLTVKTRMGYNVARSTVLLFRTKGLGQAPESASPRDRVERSADGIANAEDANYFVDFDWDDSLLDLLPRIV